MQNLNARYDTAMGRREDFVRATGTTEVDYRYQLVPVAQGNTPQTPSALVKCKNGGKGRILAGVGHSVDKAAAS